MSAWDVSGGVIPHSGGALTVVQMLGSQSSIAPGAAGWASANYAAYIPFRLASRLIVYKVTMGKGTLTGGNFDIGIFDANGNRLVSTGATARAGASTEQVIDITDTAIGPGLYYVGFSADGTNNYIVLSYTNTELARMCGILGQASAYPLPATATFAASSQVRVPALSLHLRST